MTFICAGKPGYRWETELAKLDGIAYTLFRERARSVKDKLPLSNTGEKPFEDIHLFGDLIMDDDEVSAWNNAGVEITMSRISGLRSDSRELANTTYQISVANIGLMAVQLVEVLEDCCTDNLQNYLDRGWRILAVCPPNDTRRPSYIVGHTEKEGHR